MRRLLLIVFCYDVGKKDTFLGLESVIATTVVITVVAIPPACCYRRTGIF
jgi:hypothetical protein